MKFIPLQIIVIIYFLTGMSSFAESQTHTLLKKYCYNCHDEDVQKGNFQLDVLDKDISGGDDAEKWQFVLDQLNLGEMPPKKKKQPSAEERRFLINSITLSLKRAAEHKRKDVQVVMRRLTKQQYTNSLRDILGLDINYGKPLPSERISEDGFRNNGEEQIISLLQTEYYQSIADEALQKAILDKPPISYKYSFVLGADINPKKIKKGYRKISGNENRIKTNNYITKTSQNNNIADKKSQYEPNKLHEISFVDMRGSKKQHYKIVKEGIQLDPSEPHQELYQGQNAFLSPTPNIQIQLRDFPTEGNFVLRVKVARVNPKSPDAYIRAFLGERLDWGTDSKMFEHSVKVTGTMQKFQTVEFRGRLENFPTPTFDPRHKDKNTTFIIGVINDSGKHKEKPTILVKEMEFITEPVESWPPKSHSRIFIASKNKNNEELYSREVINRFMMRAFRRPVSKEELAKFHNLWKAVRPHSANFNESIRDALSAVLSSPRFLYLVEGQSGTNEQISELELASRLSFFLWNTMPDYELLKLAYKKQLRSQLDMQVARMLKDSRSKDFVKAFTSEWLEMHKMTDVKIDTNKFREFNRYVREDMLRETRYFFTEVLKNDLSIMNFIDSEFTMVNQNLAKYYGLGGVTGPYFRRVSVKSKPERRGLISNGIFLSGNSDGQEANPIKRGVWLTSRILDDPPPEPPPNVPEIDPGDPDFAKLSLREQLEKHRQSQSCNECHQKIDPWGLLFENYNAVGKWINKKQKDVTLSNGKTLNNANDLRDYLMKERQEQFAYAMTKNLLRYGLGRTLSFVDQSSIDAIVLKSKKDGYKLKSLILEIIKNPIFSKK